MVKLRAPVTRVTEVRRSCCAFHFNFAALFQHNFHFASPCHIVKHAPSLDSGIRLRYTWNCC